MVRYVDAINSNDTSINFSIPGLAMNSGSIMAWAVASGSVPLRAVVLAIGCWSLSHSIFYFNMAID